MGEELKREEDTFINYAIGGFVTLVVGCIGWLFWTVTNNNTSISNLQTQREQNNIQKSQISDLKKELTELSNKVSSLESETKTNIPQWKSIGKIDDKLDRIDREVSSNKTKLNMVSDDVKSLQKLHTVKITHIK